MNEENFSSPLPARPATTASDDQYVANSNQLFSPEIVERKKEEKEESEKIIHEIKKERKVNKFLLIGTILLIIISILIGLFLVKKITQKTATKDETITINYWGLWEDPSIMSGVIANFEKENPGVRINYKRNQISDYRTRLKGRLAKTELSTDEIPDIFRIHNTWLPMFREELADVPTQTVANLKLDEEFYDVYKNDLKVSGKYKSIPLMYDGLVMLSNRDILAKAGVSVPLSWWGMESIFEKLIIRDKQGKVTQAAASLGTVDNVDHWSDVLGLLLKQNGADPTKVDEINNMKLKDVIKYYSLLAKKSGWDNDMPNSTMAFAGGKTAFYFGPSWRIFNIMDLNPNLNFDVNPVPQLPTVLDNEIKGDITDPNKLTNVAWASYWSEGVNIKSKHQKEAWKFLEYLASSEALQNMYTTASQSRAFGEIYPRKSMAALLEANPKIKPILYNINTATNWYLCSSTGDQGINDEMIKYFGDAVNAYGQNGSNIDEAFTPLRNGINQLINKYGITK